jgi:putative hemolysin
MSVVVLIIIAAMLALNSFFAAYELALATVRIDRLRALADQHKHGARAALRMKSRMEASLAVVQLGITFVGAIAAATGGAGTQENLAPWLQERFLISEHLADFLAVTIVVIPLAAVTIIVGELIPKVFAIQHAEWVVLSLSPAMFIFAMVTFPAVWVFETTTKLVLGIIARVFPPPPAADPRVGLHELRAQVNLLRASKVIGVAEQRIILQASRLSGMIVRDIMLPEEDIVMVLADSTLSENLVIAHMDLHTRFPVAERRGDVQSIIGYVTFKEMVLLAKTHPGNPILREITRPLISLVDELPVSDALRRMLAEHVHLSLVRSATGEIVGMLTQEDVFEELFGDIQDEFDRLPRHVTTSGHQWVVGGGATLARLRDELHRPDFGAELAPTVTLNELLQRRYPDHKFVGGDSVVVDDVWILVRKVRRKQITEALIDPDATRYVPSVQNGQPVSSSTPSAVQS